MKKSDFIFDTEVAERFFYKQLSERERRLYAGLEAMEHGYNGVFIISKKFGINKH